MTINTWLVSMSTMKMLGMDKLEKMTSDYTKELKNTEKNEPEEKIVSVVATLFEEFKKEGAY